MKGEFHMNTNAPALKRFLAFLIDWYLSSLFGSIPVIIVQSSAQKDLILLNQLDGLSLPLAWTACIAALFCHFLYYCYLPSRPGKNGLKGQTLGMRLLHLQLLSETGEPLSLGILTVRHMVFVILLQGYLTSSHLYLVSLFQMTTDAYIVPYVQTFYYIMVLLSLALYLFSRRRQLLQDRLTRSRMTAL